MIKKICQVSFSIKTIFFPFVRIRINILPDFLVVLIRADNMVVKRALPESFTIYVCGKRLDWKQSSNGIYQHEI